MHSRPKDSFACLRRIFNTWTRWHQNQNLTNDERDLYSIPRPPHRQSTNQPPNKTSFFTVQIMLF